MKILFNRYHPVVDDLALSLFYHLKYDVTICIHPLKDHYGDHIKILQQKKNLNNGLKYISSKEAAVLLSNKKFDLLGVDGVFSFDKELMAIADKVGIPHFSIAGYPHSFDEPSKNILSFSWFLPQTRYRKHFPTEGHIKILDWKNFYENKIIEKNIFVYYPEFLELKNFIIENFDISKKAGICTSIHRYQECNEWSYKSYEEVVKALKKDINHEVISNINNIDIENITSQDRKGFWENLFYKNCFLLLKSADCPGVALLEAMLSKTVPIVTKNFVLASHNQELLINNHSAIICDTINDVIEVCKKNYFTLENPELRLNTYKHVSMLTDFNRQRAGLVNFFARCLEK